MSSKDYFEQEENRAAAETIKDAVKARYGAIATTQQQPVATSVIELVESRPRQAESCCGPVSCCSPAAAEETGHAQALYGQMDLAALPDSVTAASLGCGHPTAIASLRPGETVLDLGSGGGIDCFLAAQAVGPSGYVIGIDMTEPMLELANQNKTKVGLTNVEFRRGEIEALPVESETVDVIISNCVINLSPDKAAVFREAFRVLKPGGRFIVSDIVTEGHLPAALRANLGAWAECLAGAIDQALYLQKMSQAGFVDITVETRTALDPDLLDEAGREELEQALAGSSASVENIHVYSANITAHKKI